MNENENNVVSNNSNVLNNNITSNTLETSKENATDETNNFWGSYKEPKQTKKGTGVLVAILIILIVALVGVLALHQYAESQNVFKVLIDNGFNYLEGNIKDSKSVSGTFSLKINGSSSDTSSNEIFEILNKVDLSGNYGIDYENKILSMDIKSNYDSKKLINANIYAEDSVGYIYLEDLYDKYIKTDLEDYDSMFENNNQDIKVVITSIHKALNESLKDEYFTKTKETLDGKKVDKTTIILNKTNCENIKNDFINALLNDEEFINSFAKLSDNEATDVKEMLNDSLEEEIEDTEEITASIYTNNNQFVKFEISDETDVISITKNGDNYDYSIISEEYNYNGTVSVKEESNNTICIISLKDDNNNSFEITLTSSAKYDVAIDKKDVSNSINYEKITDDEMQDIYTKIMKQDGLLDFANDISMIDDTDTYIDTDYDFDA